MDDSAAAAHVNSSVANETPERYTYSAAVLGPGHGGDPQLASTAPASVKTRINAVLYPTGRGTQNERGTGRGVGRSPSRVFFPNRTNVLGQRSLAYFTQRRMDRLTRMPETKAERTALFLKNPDDAGSAVATDDGSVSVESDPAALVRWAKTTFQRNGIYTLLLTIFLAALVANCFLAWGVAAVEDCMWFGRMAKQARG